MPTSKRNRVIPTSKTHKNRKELVRRLHANIQETCTTYNYIWVFDVQNTRNNFLKRVRADLSDSRIFLGKTKVMAIALGTNAETECVPGVSKLAEHLKGEVGLLFTNREPSEIEAYFEDSLNLDFARSGAVAGKTVTIPHGEMKTQYGVEGGEEDPLPMAIEPTLRKLGVPTRIVKGKVFLEDAAEGSMENEAGYLVCKEGVQLDSRQTSILKILGVRMAEFKMDMKAVFDKNEGKVREITGMDVDGDST